MCKMCMQNPCHPRCPNSPEPPVVTKCDNCGMEIYEGEEMYVIGHSTFCETCVNDGKTYAELEED